MKTVVKKTLDTLGVVAPALCLVHCLATPVLLTALPVITANSGHEDNDMIFHWIIVSICALAILPAFTNHRKLRVLLLFFAGAGCILIPAYISVDTFVPEIAVAIAGSACLVSANLLNRRYAQAPAPCCEHTHPKLG